MSAYWESLNTLEQLQVTEESAKYWDELAVKELDRLTWDKWADKSGCEFRANIYRRTAEALRIELRTGVSVCSCCHKPFGKRKV